MFDTTRRQIRRPRFEREIRQCRFTWRCCRGDPTTTSGSAAIDAMARRAASGSTAPSPMIFSGGSDASKFSIPAGDCNISTKSEDSVISVINRSYWEG